MHFQFHSTQFASPVFVQENFEDEFQEAAIPLFFYQSLPEPFKRPSFLLLYFAVCKILWSRNADKRIFYPKLCCSVTFHTEKSLSSKVLDKRFVCPHCGSRVFYKPRNKVAKMKAV